MMFRDETISVRGREIRLFRGGHGQPLLYLHDAWTYRWLPIHDRLAERYDVVVPIHPGFSGSSGFEEMDRVEDLVFHYLDLLEVLRLEQPILIGTSLGGWIAAEFAIRYTGMLRALVLVDALGLRVSNAPATDVFQLDPAQLRAAIFADARSPLACELVPDIPPQESIEAMLKARQVLARFAWQFPDNPKLASYLCRVKCPTLIVWGERDGVVSAEYAGEFARRIRGARAEVLPGAGHVPQLERLDAVGPMVTEFLGS
jgi:pimeloyl-ACP methyl ester carboxylesterase